MQRAGPSYLIIGVGAGAVLANLALARVGDQRRRGQLFLWLRALYARGLPAEALAG